MSIEFALLFHLLLIAIVGQCSEDTKTPITCDAGTYYVGESASVTCNFNLDMNKDGRAITVEWYPKNATTKIVGKEVFECKKKEPNQTRHCGTKANEYTFNGVINDRLTLDISSVSDKIAGIYTCFILPATGTDPNVCTLTVKAGPRPTDNKDETDESSKLWLIFLLIIPALFFVLVLAVLRFRRKRRNYRYKQQNGQTGVFQPLIPRVGWQTALPADAPMENIEELVKDFKLSTADCQRVMKLLSKAMDDNTADDTHPSVQMRPVHIRCLPKHIGDSAFLVVDFGSANLKIRLVKFVGDLNGVRSEHYTIPTAVRLGTDTQLFEFIGDCINKFVALHKLSGKRYRVCFVFSFPCEHENDLTKARLIKWTKEFNCRGVEDRDPGELLQNVLLEIMPPRQMDVRTIVSDAMGTLIYGDQDATRCKMAVTLANGFHACYMKETSYSEKHRENIVIMKTELGAFGGNKYSSNTERDTDNCLKDFITEYDTTLDKYSINRGEQILEKMVSIMYLGEIVRLVLVKLTEQRLLFKSADHRASDLHNRGCLNADHVSLIESDMSQEHFLTTFVLDKLKVKNCSDGDCRIVRYVCGVVSERAAHLAAAGLATLINRIGQPDITIAVDGPSLNIYHPHYHQHMHAKTMELVRPGLNFKIVSSQDGGARGAALVAAAVTQKPKKNKDKECQKPGHKRGDPHCDAFPNDTDTDSNKPAHGKDTAATPQDQDVGTGSTILATPTITTTAAANPNHSQSEDTGRVNTINCQDAKKPTMHTAVNLGLP